MRFSDRFQAFLRFSRPLLMVAAVLLPGVAQAQTTGSISGTVTDAASGAPLSGINVLVITPVFEDVGTTVTNASGAYTVTGVPPGQYIVAAFPNDNVNYFGEIYDNILCGVGCESEGFDATLVTVSAGGTTPNINFSLIKGGIVTGMVTNAATGAPLPNVTVTAAVRLGVNVEIIGSVTTDASGGYTGFPLPEGPVYLYTSNTQGFVNEIYGNVPCVGACSANTALTVGTPVQVTHGGTVSGRNFALDPGGRVSGTVTNGATGAPIANIGVNILARIAGANVTVATATTNASGAYVAGGLATGTYFAFTGVGNSGVMNEIYDNLLCPLGCTNFASGTPIQVTAGDNAPNRNFVLDPGGSITGQVVNQAGNTPLQSVVVTAVMRVGTTFFTRTATTNAQGRYNLAGLPTGTYWLFTSNSQGFINEIFDNVACVGPCNNAAAAASGAPLAVTVGGTVSDRNFALVQGGGITGTVRDAATGVVLEDENDIFFELYLQQPGGARTFMSSTFIDDGVYRFTGLPAGNYVVMTGSISVEGESLYTNQIYSGITCVGPCSSMTGTTPTLVPVAAAVVSGIDFNLSIGGEISGKVTSAATGQPQAGVTVSVYQRSGTNGIFAGSGVTDHIGRYFVPSLPPGTYVAFTANTMALFNEIYNNLPCATTCSVATAVASGTPITVNGTGLELLLNNHFALEVRNAVPGAPTNFRATATGATAQFTWTAPTPSTSGVAASYVIEAGTAPGATLVTLPAGTGTSFSLPGVPNGVFYVRARAVNAAGTGPASNEVTLTVAGGTSPPDAPTGLVPFSTAGLLTFTWQPATTGSVATGYVVEAGSASGRSDLASVQVTTPSFAFNGVPPGFYFLRVRAVNAAGSSLPSVEQMMVVGGVPAPPGAPAFTSSPVSARRITLTWSPPTIGTATSYIIEAGSATGLANLANVDTGSTAITVSFDNVPSGTYYIRLRAVNAQGASVVSNERTVTVQ